MTQVAINGGFFVPYGPQFGRFVGSTTATVDAATEKVALIGHCYIDGRPGGTKTISAVGGGSIGFSAGAVTFANGGTTLDVGIQDVTPSAGPTVRPDGTFDVKRTLTGGGGGLTTTAWNTVSMTGGTGTKSIAHGDLVAVVLDMTARAGADSVVVRTQNTIFPNTPQRSIVATFIASAWDIQAALPVCVITFDDGTLGILDGTVPYICDGSLGRSSESFSDSTNPDERGTVFQVPWDCKIDAFWGVLQGSGATNDFTVALYSDPNGTPASVASVAVLGEQLGGSFQDGPLFLTLASQVSLSRNTDYCIAVRATAAGSIDMYFGLLSAATWRTFYPCGTTMSKATRNNGSGAFSKESPALTVYELGVRISSFDNGAGSGGLTQLVNSQGLVG